MMSIKKEFFSAEPVNRGRQTELDVAKAVNVFLLAFIHCIIECTAEENIVSGIPYLFDTVIGGPLAAPVFMFAMGVGMAYTKNSAPRDFARRGLRLGIVGLALNICRYTIPFLVGYAITMNEDKYIAPLLYRTWCDDILQFASLAILLIAILKWLKLSDMFILIISVGMSIVSMFFNGIEVGNPLGNIFLGYLIGIEDAAGKVFSDFPLLNWFIVPVFGYIFGKYLIRVKNKKKFYLTLSPACLLITLFYFIVGIKNRAGMFGDGQNCYYHILTNDVLVSILAVIGFLGIYFYVMRWIPKWLMYWIKDLSNNITSIYCVQWVLVVFVTNVMLYVVRGTQELSVPITLLLSLGISVSAIALSHFWSYRSKFIKGKRG